jgi:hypothetical protein
VFKKEKTLMSIKELLNTYIQFKEGSLTNRFFKHHHIVALVNKLPDTFKVTIVGLSVEKRDLHLIEWGSGPIKVFLWSQMHGDEATGTMALFDLINFLQDQSSSEIVKSLNSDCKLYFLPMVNPDGAEKFTRRNSQQIDINRDYKAIVSTEAQVLKRLREEINPEYGFNLHDQSTLWSVSRTGNPAALSYLAPAYNESLEINNIRKNAMLIIADIFKTLNTFLPDRIGLFNDEYEERAFGDNFQQSGTSTLLIEAGGMIDDEEKQDTRKYFFLSILTGLISIQSNSFKTLTIEDYSKIPANSKGIFHIIIRNVLVNGIIASIGVCYEEEPVPDGLSTVKTYFIKDLGDLDDLNAYHTYDGIALKVVGDVKLNKNADFQLYEAEHLLLSFKNGNLQTKLNH